VLLAFVMYVVSGVLIGGIAFGDRGESPAASAAVAIAAGVVALVAVVLLRVHRMTLGDVNWEVEEWALRRPSLAIMGTSIATAFFIWSLNRNDVRSIPAGALAGVFFGWIGLRRSRERHGVAPASTDAGHVSMEVRLDNWRLHHPAQSILLFVIVCVAFCTLAGSRPVVVPVEVVVGLVIGWTSLRHSRARHDLVPPPGSGGQHAPPPVGPV
jgi:hypothetical protein